MATRARAGVDARARRTDRLLLFGADPRWPRRAGWMILALGLAWAMPAREALAQTVRDSILTVAVAPQYRVGAIEGADWQTFADVAAVAFDPAGRLAVLDAGNDRVVLVGRDGRLVRTIGRSGRGPGELSRPIGLATTEHGELIVFDAGASIFTVYDTAGASVRQYRPPFGGRYPGRRIRAAPSGGVVSVSGDGLALIDPREGESPVFRIHRYDLIGGAEPAFVAEAWRPGAVATTGRGVGGRRVGFATLPAFAPRLFFDVLPDGRVVFADSADYRIEVAGGAGATVSIGRPIPPRPTTDRDRARERDRRRHRPATGRGIPIATGADFERRLADLEFWPEIPVIQGLRTDPDGRIWVARAGDGDAPPPIDLLTPEGVYLGTIRAEGIAVPDALGPDGLLAFIETGESDVPVVRVVRVVIGGARDGAR